MCTGSPARRNTTFHLACVNPRARLLGARQRRAARGGGALHQLRQRGAVCDPQRLAGCGHPRHQRLHAHMPGAVGTYFPAPQLLPFSPAHATT